MTTPSEMMDVLVALGEAWKLRPDVSLGDTVFSICKFSYDEVKWWEVDNQMFIRQANEYIDSMQKYKVDS